MTAALIAAHRHLIGLSQQELADELGVNRHTVKDWESGRLRGAPGAMLDLGRLVAEHDAETEALAVLAAEGRVVTLPSRPRPKSWYLAIGARLLAADRDVMLEWAPSSPPARG